MQHGIAVDDNDRDSRVAAAVERLLEPDVTLQVLLQNGPKLVVEGNRIQTEQTIAGRLTARSGRTRIRTRGIGT